MIKKISGIGILILMMFSLGGCSAVGNKTATLSVIYIATSVLSMLLLTSYCLLIKKREPWFVLLFSAVVVVNIGYLSLSISSTLNEALLSNRIAYLGSVFLPVSMLMAIIKTCNVKIPKWAVGVLIGISMIVFLIAASPGYLDIYYKEVELITINGATALKKVYGPLHSIYLYYLLSHFVAMVGVILYSRIKDKIKSSLHATLLTFSVLVNIGVWLMEQFVDIDFEVLSISYIATELFLLGISLLIQDISLQSAIGLRNHTSVRESDSRTEETHKEVVSPVPTVKTTQEKTEYLTSALRTLTPTESTIYKLYLEGKKTKDVMAELNITENTLKYHNRNIYSKLGVSNRKELIEVSIFANSAKV